MRNNSRTIGLILVLISVICNFSQAQRMVHGKVIDSTTGIGISGSTILIKEAPQIYTTDSMGCFIVEINRDTVEIFIRKMGYELFSGKIHYSADTLFIRLKPDIIEIEEVQINTGYQWIPKERATGSFMLVNEKELSSIPGRTIMERLNGLMPGLQFDDRKYDYKGNSPDPTISVRGINTFRSSTSRPLVILDNFPYEGDLADINPNDVESVTLMRDAAATSTWGARAGNGVLVINLKKVGQSGKAAIDFSSGIRILPKPDLFYMPVMSSSEFVDVELFLYENNFYRTALSGSNAFRSIFTPVVQAKYDYDLGLIDQEEVNNIIQNARTHDYRNDLLQHFYREQTNVNYNISLQMHTGKHGFRFSAGRDEVMGTGNMVGNRSNIRNTFRLFNSYQLTKGVSVDLNVNYFDTHINNGGSIHYPINSGGGKTFSYPYLTMIDEAGRGLSIAKDWNSRYVDSVGGGRLLDWRFNPMEDLSLSKAQKHSSNLNPTLTIRYSPFTDLTFHAIYSGEFQNSTGAILYNEDSYFVRNQINLFSQINSDQVIRPIPIGDILKNDYSKMVGHKLRLQVGLTKNLFTNGYFSWITGGEIGDLNMDIATNTSYGYDDNLRLSIPVDHVTRFPLIGGGSNTISNGESYGFNTRRIVSLYSNASFTYHNKYTLSASMRRDGSNEFGVKSNERWNPLWSVGIVWNLFNERFMEESTLIDNLKIRYTLGHSGNLGGGTTSDRAILSYNSNSAYTGLPYAIISSPPNPSLRWEDVQMKNLALDFSAFDRVIEGSIEFYKKNVTDIISQDQLDRTTGFPTIVKNVGEIDGEGVDFNLKVNLDKGVFNWSVSTSFSYNQDLVREYKGTNSSTNLIVSSGETQINPIKGRHLMSIYSYRFEGLDPQNGDPLGYFNGEVSKNYSRMLNDSLQNLIYHGSSRPLYFGFLNNHFQYKNISLFTSIDFRAGHYFRNTTIRYLSLFNNWDTHSDYAKRWQSAGDEEYTTVPSMIYPANNSRDSFYANSQINVERGDVIRLKEIGLNYTIASSIWKIKRIQMGFNAQNIAIIWKAAQSAKDPDFLSIPKQTTYSMNLKINI